MTIRVLYTESGTSGGGSFESLYQHLLHIDRAYIAPQVMFLNETRFVSMIRELDIPVHVLNDDWYSNDNPPWKRRICGRLTKFVAARCPRYYVRLKRIIHRRLVARLERLIRREDFDLIHANDQPERDMFAMFAAESTGVPLVSHIRSCACERLTGPAATYANGATSRFVSAAKLVADMWTNRGIDADKLNVVHNGVPKIAPAPPLPAILDFDNSKDTPIVACVGRLIGWKGQTSLLKAFETVIKEIPAARLVLVGDGPCREDYEQLAEQLRIRHAVGFTGYVDNAKHILQSVQCNVLPSSRDVCSRVILESMVCGTPVIAASAGGNSELIDHDRTGLLYEISNTPALATEIIRILSDSELRNRIRQAGMIESQKRFSLESYCSQIEQIYRQILDKNPKAAVL